MPTNAQGLLSPSDIAELADVSRGAVSNWRKRSDDFPEPSAGTAAKPLFDRSAIEAWLANRGIEIKEDRGESRVWGALNALRGALSMNSAADLFLTVACIRKASGREAWSEIVAARGPELKTLMEETKRDLSQDLVSLPEAIDSQSLEIVISVVDTLEPHHLANAVDSVMERLAKSMVKAGGEYGFVGSQASELLANLATSNMKKDVIYDPACGHAIALIETAKAGAGRSNLIGSDISLDALRIARQRAYLHNVSVDLIPGDVLSMDPVPDLKADVVIAEPPFGMRMNSLLRMTDARYEFGTPPATYSEMAWIQHAIAHLNASGRAYVLTPHGPLFRGSKEQTIRTEMVRRGDVEFIVGLPPRLLPHTSMPLALWVLRSPTTSPPESITFLDASDEEEIEFAVPQWLSSPDVRPTHLTAEVSVADILAENANLVPMKWIDEEKSIPDNFSSSVAEQWSQLREDLRSLAGMDEITLANPELFGARTQTVDELVQDRLVEVRTGKPTKSYDGLPAALRERVLTAADVVSGDIEGFEEEPQELPENVEITKPNDVLVTTMHSIRARVDETGGHLPGTGVYRLRVLEPAVLSPEYLAMVIAGKWNARLMTGSTILKAKIRELEVPLLPPDDQTSLVSALAELGQIREQANRLVHVSESLQDRLLGIVRFGLKTGVNQSTAEDNGDN